MYKYLLPLLILASCSAENRLQKIAAKHPVALAKVCMKTFLVKDSVITRDSIRFDTVSVAVDPYIPEYFDIPKETYSNYSDTIAFLNRLRALAKERIKCPPVQVITKTIIHDSIVYRENTAKVVFLESALDDKQDEITLLKGDIETLQGKLHRCRKINFWLYVIIGGLVAWTFRKLLVTLLNPIARFYPF